MKKITKILIVFNLIAFFSVSAINGQNNEFNLKQEKEKVEQEFMIKIFVKDEFNNKDSILLGYDELATDSIDVIFDEENIFFHPWKINVDMRAGEASIMQNNLYDIYPSIFHTKKQIINKTCNFFHMIKIEIKSSNFPIEVSWDTSYFTNDSCIYSSYITTGTFWGGDYFDGLFKAMNPKNLSYTDNKLIINNIGQPYSPVFYNQNGEQVIQLHVSFGSKEPETIINEYINNQHINIYPNPNNGDFNIHIPNNLKFTSMEIYNNFNQLVKTITFNESEKVKNDYKCNDFSNGLYTILFKNKNGTRLIKKLLIIKN